MPRQREADDEDMMARCPQCKGQGRIYRFDINAEDDCPLCEGAGRVNQHTYASYIGP